MEIRELLPKNKFDNSNINRLFLLTDEEIKPIIYELLEWTQDYNWPIAKEIIPVLLESSYLLIPADLSALSIVNLIINALHTPKYILLRIYLFDNSRI